MNFGVLINYRISSSKVRIVLLRDKMSVGGRQCEPELLGLLLAVKSMKMRTEVAGNSAFFGGGPFDKEPLLGRGRCL